MQAIRSLSVHMRSPGEDLSYLRLILFFAQFVTTRDYFVKSLPTDGGFCLDRLAITKAAGYAGAFAPTAPILRTFFVPPICGIILIGDTMFA